MRNKISKRKETAMEAGTLERWLDGVLSRNGFRKGLEELAHATLSEAGRLEAKKALALPFMTEGEKEALEIMEAETGQEEARPRDFGELDSPADCDGCRAKGSQCAFCPKNPWRPTWTIAEGKAEKKKRGRRSQRR